LAQLEAAPTSFDIIAITMYHHETNGTIELVRCHYGLGTPAKEDIISHQVVVYYFFATIF